MELDENEDLEEEFGFSRNYFLAKESAASSGKKSAASKLSDIGRIDEKELRAIVSGLKPKHENEIKLLVNSYRDFYSKWLFELRCGFNLLTYGFGSKKALLEDFASTLTSYGVVVINGYLQHINIRQAAVTIAEILQEEANSVIKSSRRHGLRSESISDLTSIEDAISYLSSVKLQDGSFVCVVIHNIDGPGLRDSDTQQYLARIASCSHIRFIASIDHINAPLLWDKKMVHSQFNWCWYHVPTFESYKVEGMFLPLVLAGGATVQSAKTALIVLQSLTPNAQSVFRIIADYQLAHPKEEGVPINTLYNMCRERFLVSNQMTLNSHLTEFKDHELIKMRKHSEGQDCFCVPLTAEALGKLLQDLG